MSLEQIPPRLRHALGAGALTLAVLAAVGFIAYGVGYNHGEVAPDDWRPLLPTVAAVTTPSPLSAGDVARDAIGGVVTVEAVRPGAQALGTAWLLDDRGDFVTNAHVVLGDLGIRLRDRSGRTHVGTLVASDRERDLAIVRSADGFPRAPLELERGGVDVPQPVVDISTTRATGHDDIIMLRAVRLHVDVPVRGNPDVDPSMGTTTVVYPDMMGLEGAHIFSGNSGGPVLDLRGRVIGIVTLASRSEDRAFAIPILRVAGELADLSRR